MYADFRHSQPATMSIHNKTTHTIKKSTIYMIRLLILKLKREVRRVDHTEDSLIVKVKGNENFRNH